jgi:hypothetical protein
MMNHDELRHMAEYFRLIAMDGEDLYLVFALRQLAEEFDAEAAVDVWQKKAQTVDGPNLISCCDSTT